jgi:sugar phosphate isomerase/epimerase
MPGRRYEQFQSVEEFRQLSERGQRALERAVPIVERHRVRLAVENHKDHRVEERLALLEHLESTCVGACVDVGNNFALLEEPVAVVEALAPWAFSVHIKDQAVQEYDEGFLFADVPLGEGFLDLRKMVDILRRAKPEVRFNLETITRDPLKVPVLTDKYWATLGDVSGSELARTLRVVRTRRAQQLPQISQLPPAEQLASEAAGIVKSLQYAREKLGL